MAAYVIVDVDIADEERAAHYRELSGPSVTRHGGRFLVRGGATSVFEGDWEPRRTVVIEFPTMTAARAWYDSDDYAEARAVRADAGAWRMVAVEGVE